MFYNVGIIQMIIACIILSLHISNVSLNEIRVHIFPKKIPLRSGVKCLHSMWKKRTRFCLHSIWNPQEDTESRSMRCKIFSWPTFGQI